MPELRINLRGIIPPGSRPAAEDSPTHRAILAIGRQITEAMARARLTVAASRRTRRPVSGWSARAG